jgi:DNA-binding NtrC family response regulator
MICGNWLALTTSKRENSKGKSQSFRPGDAFNRWRGGPDMVDILVVDDDEVIRETLNELLSASYSCQTADTAEAALAKLEAQRFEVVLTDISMPGLNGMDLLKRVVEKYPGTPVIIISGHSDQDHAQGLIGLGAFDYLLKPFRLEAVEESVKRAVDKSKS